MPRTCLGVSVCVLYTCASDGKTLKLHPLIFREVVHAEDGHLCIHYSQVQPLPPRQRRQQK